MVYTIPWILNLPKDSATGELIGKRIIPFWGSDDTPYETFSNFHPCSLQWNGITFPTSEHLFMAHKAMYFGDVDILQDIITADSPGKAKRLGRKVAGFDQQIWSNISYDIMKIVCYQKIQQNPDIQEVLINTGDAIIVEASPYDRIWGIGLAPTDPDVYLPEKWNGDNRLGFVLMEIRDLIINRPL